MVRMMMGVKNQGKLRQEETLNGTRFPVHIRKKLRPENLCLNFDDDFNNLDIVGL